MSQMNDKKLNKIITNTITMTCTIIKTERIVFMWKEKKNKTVNWWSQKKKITGKTIRDKQDHYKYNHSDIHYHHYRNNCTVHVISVSVLDPYCANDCSWCVAVCIKKLFHQQDYYYYYDYCYSAFGF